MAGPLDDRVEAVLAALRREADPALPAIGGKTNPSLRAAARAAAGRLAASSDRTARWNGKDALRAFARSDAKGARA